MVSPKRLFVGNATIFGKFGKFYIYKIKKTIFEELHDMGFVFEDNDNFFPYFATWDLESFQTAVTNDSELARLQFACGTCPRVDFCR